MLWTGVSPLAIFLYWNILTGWTWGTKHKPAVIPFFLHLKILCFWTKLYWRVIYPKAYNFQVKQQVDRDNNRHMPRTGASLMTGYCELESPPRLNILDFDIPTDIKILYWNILTEQVFHTGLSLLSDYFGLENPYWFTFFLTRISLPTKDCVLENSYWLNIYLYTVLSLLTKCRVLKNPSFLPPSFSAFRPLFKFKSSVLEQWHCVEGLRAMKLVLFPLHPFLNSLTVVLPSLLLFYTFK